MIEDDTRIYRIAIYRISRTHRGFYVWVHKRDQFRSSIYYLSVIEISSGSYAKRVTKFVIFKSIYHNTSQFYIKISETISQFLFSNELADTTIHIEIISTGILHRYSRNT